MTLVLEIAGGVVLGGVVLVVGLLALDLWLAGWVLRRGY
jgi:hypothetical protein